MQNCCVGRQNEEESSGHVLNTADQIKGNITASEHDLTMLERVYGCVNVYVCLFARMCVCVGNARLANSTAVRGTEQDKQR